MINNEFNIESIEYNQYLLNKYPWLKVHGYENCNEFTALSSEMPIGWQIRFGEELCEEIDQELIKEGIRDTYFLYQVKEKFGSLRWYGSVDTPQLNAIIDKYEEISSHTCITCGKEATYMSKNGWISPFCDDCVNRYASNTLKIFPNKGNQTIEDIINKEFRKITKE